ncbi:UHRF1-like protein [Stygiomarasmius scandens]|uniref:UHRF1-like protein n=1 Tax=Marasmiellus scandens TaxID=2682957 RepID=A0ABR1JMB1_9AGAR
MASRGERERDANIAKNKALLLALGLDKPMFEPKEKRHRPEVPSKKRKAKEEDSSEPPRKSARAESNSDENEPKTEGGDADTSIRRSTRIREKKDEAKEKALSPSSNDHDSEPRHVSKRIHDPKVFGSIPGVDVGTWWESRAACSLDAIHAPWVGGISGGKKGAYSVALSGGYEDDVDLGYAFTYTGSGGRDLRGTKTNPKNLRTAPQSSDQTFDDSGNFALKRSSETKKPVRVIRGYKLNSPYAPSEGYRYDGLYTVEKAWMEKGLNPHGYLVCKFAFKRLPNQPPLPVRHTESEST